MLIDELTQEKTLVVTNNRIKKSLLEKLNQRRKIYDIKFISREDFINRITFSFSKKTIFYIYQKYHYKIDIIYSMLTNMRYVLNDDVNNIKIHHLYLLRQELVDNGLIEFDMMFINTLKNYKVIFLGCEVNDFMISKLNNYAIYDNFNESNNDNNNINVYEFNTINEEVEYVFNEIAELIKKGVPINNIKLVNVSSEYKELLYRFSKMYQINININSDISIYGTKICKIFLDNISLEKSELIEVLNQYNKTYIYQRIIDLINEYYFVSDLNSVKDLIIYDLKQIKIKSIEYTNAIEIIDYDTLVDNEMYLFMLSFNMENVPLIMKDEEYFSDIEKVKLGLNSTLSINEINSKKVVNFINGVNNLVITYKLRTAFNKYFPSSLIENIKANVIRITDIVNKTSDIYNKLKLSSKLDDLIKYGDNNQINDLYETYKDIPYLTYDNQFSGIDYSKLKDFINRKINLSYTSINEYNGCAFKYYINYILKLNPYEDEFHLFVGNLYHDILSKCFENDFDFEKEFNHYLTKRVLSPMEEFFIAILKEELVYVILNVKRQHQLSGFKNYTFEKRISLEYDGDIKLFITGVVDKIMYQLSDNYTLVSVIDYKTGALHSDIRNMKYGMDMQLPFYLYLIDKIPDIKNVTVVGIYLQKIIHEEVLIEKNKTYDEIKRNRLKLVGYSLDNEDYLSIFDPSYKDSELIKGMKVTNNNSFYHYTKVFNESMSVLIKNYIEKIIFDTFDNIKSSNFSINPKVIEKAVTCQNCKFQDLCFVKEKDYIYLDKVLDLNFLGGDDDA